MTIEQPYKEAEDKVSDKSLGEKFFQGWDHFCIWVWDAKRTGRWFGLALLRNILRIIFIVARESREDRITLRASALTFTVVLSLVPMLALGTAVLKGLGGGDQMRQVAYSFVAQFDAGNVEIPAMPQSSELQTNRKNIRQPQPAAADEKSSTSIAEQPNSVTSHLRRAIDQIFDYVERTNFATLGTLGIIGMVLAALGVLGSIEQSMNTIWQTTTGRALGRKLIDYMALMILLPVSINLALATSATLHNPTLHSLIQNIIPILWFEKFILNALPIAMLVVTFLLLYQFLPNTRVGFIPALVGGLFGGLAWYFVQIMYVKMQIGVAKYNAIYGSFATLPLFFLWIYIAWVVFLLGAEVAFAFQNLRQYQWKSILITPSARLAMAFDIMKVALADYEVRKITDRKTLAEILIQNEKTVGIIVNELVEGGLLRRVDGKLEGYVPTAPIDDLKPSEIMDIILGKDLPDVKGCNLTGQALQAARNSLDRYNINCQEVVHKNNLITEDSDSGAI